jgi:hypothetical protein
MVTQWTYQLGQNTERAWRNLDRRAKNALAAAGVPVGTAKLLL